jgi:hypothetical protein
MLFPGWLLGRRLSSRGLIGPDEVFAFTLHHKFPRHWYRDGWGPR